MRAILVIACSFFFAAGVYAQDANDLLQQGNSYYASEEYQKAIDSYQRVLEQRKESAALYFNMGNAFFRLNKLPEAVLYYEKAKLLAPNDREIQENLEMARSLTGDEIEAVPEFFLTRWRKAVMNWMHADTWGIMSLTAFLLMLVAAGFVVTGRSAQAKRLAFSLGVVLLLVAGVSFSLGHAQKNRIQAHDTAIVFSPSVTVRSAPSSSGTSLFVLHQGTKVRIQETTEKWYEIRIANGEVGWLKKEAVRRI